MHAEHERRRPQHAGRVRMEAEFDEQLVVKAALEVVREIEMSRL